jgi:hypothetical protein
MIPMISHRILKDQGLEPNGEKIIKLNKEILQKVINGDDTILDEMWNLAGSMVVKHAINIITYYTKIIKEEIEDFTWMIDEPLNPWDEYDMIIFDQKPTKEEINNYIELALNTKNPKNKESWEIGRKEDLKLILNYFKKYGEAILNVDENNNLVYAEPTYVNRNPSRYNSIKYSQLVNSTIKESKEEDDFDWARDIEPDLKVKINDLREGLRVKINTNKEDYGVFFRNDLHYYMEQSGGGEGTVRYWSTPDGNNTWVTVEWDNGLRDTYRNTYPLHEEYDIYSLLMVIDQPLTESEEDDWDWARGPIWVDEVNKGNRIRVHNKGDEDAFINWLGMYSDDYIAGDFGENIEGIVSKADEDEFTLEVVLRGSGFEHSIYFPYKKQMEYIRMSNEEYGGLDLEYELIPEPI